MSIRGIDGFQFYDTILSLIGVTGWMIVGLLWKDRALILLNGAGIVLFIRTLVSEYWI
jgi:ABC-type siderophore export system fused ATPase/permease subunit